MAQPKPAAKKTAAKKAAAKKAAPKRKIAKAVTKDKPAAYRQTGKRGRPPGSSCLTDEQCQKVLDRVCEGDTIMGACYKEGIIYNTMYYRLRRDFPQETNEAERMGAEALVQMSHDDLDPPDDGAKLLPHQVTLRIARSKNKLWRAERMAPDRFSQRSQVEHSTPEGKPLEINTQIDPSEAYMKHIRGNK
ncbi:hypothetical protein [Algiphilus aromaticivorans]|uniref:hypothetical protein n=1 Tax=Algiphilus aromaticivorans TaxID=382454 RepID=UPI0005C1A244|nr:hypothetical protein [Algiphilus aromaticivorans]